MSEYPNNDSTNPDEPPPFPPGFRAKKSPTAEGSEARQEPPLFPPDFGRGTRLSPAGASSLKDAHSCVPPENRVPIECYPSQGETVTPAPNQESFGVHSVTIGGGYSIRTATPQGTQASVGKQGEQEDGTNSILQPESQSRGQSPGTISTLSPPCPGSPDVSVLKERMSVKGVTSVTPTAKKPEQPLSLWQAYVAELNGHRQMTVGERRKAAVIALAVLLVGGTIIGLVVMSFGNSQAYKEGYNTAYQGAVELSKISRITGQSPEEWVKGLDDPESDAARTGASIPYPPGSRTRAEWVRGYRDGLRAGCR